MAAPLAGQVGRRGTVHAVEAYSTLPGDVLTRISTRSGFLTARDAHEIGLSRSEIDALVRAGLLERVVRGIYAMPLEQPSPEAAYRRFVLAALAGRPGTPGDIVLAGPAAAVLLGLPLFGRAPTVVHVAAPHDHGRKDGRLLQPLGALSSREITQAGPWRVANPARAAIDTARVLTTVSGVVAADAALRLGMADHGELVDACARVAGRTGVGRARRTVRLADGLSESPGESWSAVVIDDLGLPAAERQHPFEDEDGFIGRVDFWWPEHRVVGEFDGRVKYGRVNPSGRPPEDVLWEEKRREDRLRAADQAVVRWTSSDLARPHALQRRLSAALTRAHR